MIRVGPGVMSVCNSILTTQSPMLNNVRRAVAQVTRRTAPSPWRILHVDAAAAMTFALSSTGSFFLKVFTGCKGALVADGIRKWHTQVISLSVCMPPPPSGACASASASVAPLRGTPSLAALRRDTSLGGDDGLPLPRQVRR